MNIPPNHNDRAPVDVALRSYDHTARWYSGHRSDDDNASPPDAVGYSPPPMFPGFELEGQRDLYFGEAISGPTHASGTHAGGASMLSGTGAMLAQPPTRASSFYGQTDHSEYTVNAPYVDEAEARSGTEGLNEFLALLASADQSMTVNAPSSSITPETSTGVGQHIASHAQSYQLPTEDMPAVTYLDGMHAYAASTVPSLGAPVSDVGLSVEDTMPFSAYLQNYQRPVDPALPYSYSRTRDDQLAIPAYSGTAPPPMPAGAGGASRPMHASNHLVNIQGPYGGWRERATVPAGTYTPSHAPQLDWNQANFDATSLARAPFSVTSTAPFGNRGMNEGRQTSAPRVPASTGQGVGVQRTRRARAAPSSTPYPIPVRNDGCNAQVADIDPSTVAHAVPSYGEFSFAGVMTDVPQPPDANANDSAQTVQQANNTTYHEQSHPAPSAVHEVQVPPADKTWVFDKETRKLRVYTGAPLSTPARPGAKYPVCHPRPMGLNQYCAHCWDAGKKVVWMDDERRKKHDLREHSQHGHPPRGVNPKHKRR